VIWGQALKRVRRYIRDPDGNIWSTDLLRELWNEVQREFQTRTSILEDVRTISVPPRFHATITHDFEYAFAPGTVHYRALRQQQNHFTACYVWEVQEHFALEADISDINVAIIHPWEGWASDPSDPPPFPLPADYHEGKAMYYDLEPLPQSGRKAIQRSDPSWRSRTGEPICWARVDDASNQFFLYPLPSTVVWNDETGDGMVTSVSGDTTGAEVGVVTQRTGTVLSGELGVGVEVLEADDNLLAVFEVAPVDVVSEGTEIAFPDYLEKYIRHGVVSRAYGANTDGHIPSLAAYWAQRYEMGIEATKRFARKRRRDRDYQFRTHQAASRRSRRPRLPDGYPAA